MVKVVLVDDEELVIEVFKNSVDWGKYDMEVVRAFLDPNDAYDYLVQNDADIVFTDIKMPVMNGDVLIEKVGAVKPYIHFVAVSAYDDYLSVKNAFKHGALDYILKINVDSEEMDNLLKKLQLICKEKNLNNIDTNINHVLQRMEGAINTGNEAYAFVVDSNSEKGTAFLKKGLDQLNSLFSMKWLEYNGILIILLNTGHPHCIKEFCTSIAEMASTGEPVYCGASRIRNSAAMAEAFSRAKKAHGIARFYEKGLIVYDELSEYHENAAETQNRILESIKKLEIEKITDIIEDCFKTYKDNKLEKRQIITNIIHLHDFIINTFLLNHILPKYDLSINLESLLERCSTFTDLKDYFIDFFKKLTENSNLYKNKDIIELITGYIHSHYRERFSLEDISVKFGISPSHLSRSFYKKTGIHFIEYVNQVKINKAKQLLINSNMIISEIFEDIGYDNLEHFSRVFKKYVGVSPSKYRSEIVGPTGRA